MFLHLQKNQNKFFLCTNLLSSYNSNIFKLLCPLALHMSFSRRYRCQSVTFTLLFRGFCSWVGAKLARREHWRDSTRATLARRLQFFRQTPNPPNYYGSCLCESIVHISRHTNRPPAFVPVYKLLLVRRCEKRTNIKGSFLTSST